MIFWAFGSQHLCSLNFQSQQFSKVNLMQSKYQQYLSCSRKTWKRVRQIQPFCKLFSPMRRLRKWLQTSVLTKPLTALAITNILNKITLSAILKLQKCSSSFIQERSTVIVFFYGKLKMWLKNLLKTSLKTV